MDRREYRNAAKARLRDAQILLGAKRYAGAYYLAGYVIECALKATIARQFRASNIPEYRMVQAIYTHTLDDLVGLANLRAELDSLNKTDKVFQLKWLTVRGWRETSRYQAQRSAAEARDMYDGVADTGHGVLQWLQRHW